MEHSTLSPVARTPGRFVRPAVLLSALSALLVLSSGTVRAADPATPAVPAPSNAPGAPFAGNPARDMPTGDLPELAAPPPAQLAAPPPRPNHDGPSTATHRLGSLIDRDVVAPDGGHIGQVIDVLLDQEGHPAAIVVDVGGFLGVGNRRIAIAWDAFGMGNLTEQSPVKLHIEAAAVRSAPAYDPTSMNVTVVQAPPPAPVVPTPPPAAPVAPVMAPAEAEPAPVSVEPQPAPPPLVPGTSGGGEEGPPAGHAASGRSGFMAR